jgi:uncharacterized protein Smg (DUF494 family)
MNNLNEVATDFSLLFESRFNDMIAEANLTNQDIKSLFKYLSSTREDTRGFISKAKSFPQDVYNSTAYKSVVSAMNTYGLRADIVVADKIKNLFSDISLLSKSVKLSNDASADLKEIHSLHKKYPKLAPTIFAVTSAITSKMKTDPSNLDEFIKLSKYTVNQHIAGEKFKDSVSSEFDNSVEILRHKSLTDNSKRKLEDLYDLSVGNAKKEKYISQFFNRVKELRDDDKDNFISKHYEYLKSVLSSQFNESVLVEFDFIKRKLKRFGQKTGLLDKDKATFNDLMQAWQSYGEPNDADEIAGILSDLGFTRREVYKAFKLVGIDLKDSIDQEVYDLFKVVQDNSLQPYVLKFLKKFYPKDVAKKSLTESVSLTADSINLILTNLIKISSQRSARPVEMEYLYNWAKEIKSSNKDDKVQLVREIVNFLSDRSNSDDWEKYHPIVTKTLRQANLDPSILKSALINIKQGNAYQVNTEESLNKESVDMIDFICEIAEVSLDDAEIEINEANNKYTLTDQSISANMQYILEKALAMSVYGRGKKCL